MTELAQAAVGRMRGSLLGPYTLGRLADAGGGVGVGLAVLAGVALTAMILGIAVSRSVLRSARA